MQEGRKIQIQQDKAVQEARNIANARLNEEMTRMNKDNESFTPQNAFTKFVSKKLIEIQGTYASMFNYQQDKIKSAQNIRDQILQEAARQKMPGTYTTKIRQQVAPR